MGNLVISYGIWSSHIVFNEALILSNPIQPKIGKNVSFDADKYVLEGQTH